jgi:hypothetical protein
MKREKLWLIKLKFFSIETSTKTGEKNVSIAKRNQKLSVLFFQLFNLFKTFAIVSFVSLITTFQLRKIYQFCTVGFQVQLDLTGIFMHRKCKL